MGEQEKYIGCRLGEIIRERGLRQDWLCQKSGVSQANMSRLASGKMFPTVLTAHRISRALGLKIEDIWYWREDGETE